MVLRISLFALMALGLLGFGTVAWISSRPPPPPRPPGAGGADQNHCAGGRASDRARAACSSQRT